MRHGRFALTVLAVGLIMAPAAPAAAVAAPAGGLRLVERPAAGVAELAASGPSSATAVRPAAGDRLLIAAIAVDARIEPVGVDPAGNMATPSSPQTVAWYRFGPRPGAVGDAVLAGHLDWTSGPAVFWNLHRLAAGDVVVVAPAGGPPLRFHVTSVSSYAATARPPAGLFALSGPRRLSLITCAGSWDARRGMYAERLVVEAVLD